MHVAFVIFVISEISLIHVNTRERLQTLRYSPKQAPR